MLVFIVGSKTYRNPQQVGSLHVIFDIETRYAKVEQQKSTKSCHCWYNQNKMKGFFLTVFWADNCDMIVENVTGGGSVHTTH